MTLTDSQPHVEGQGRTSSVARAVHAAHDHLFKEAGLDPAHAYDEIIRVLAALTHLRRSGVLLNERSLADTIEHHASAVLDELAAGTELAVAFGRPSVEDPILDRLVEILSTLDLESSMGDSDPFGIIFQQV